MPAGLLERNNQKMFMWRTGQFLGRIQNIFCFKVYDYGTFSLVLEAMAWSGGLTLLLY